MLNRTAISQAATDNVGVPRLAEFMHEADVGNDHVVLQTDAGMTAWTRRALRQADRVVVVCSPNPDAAERSLISDIFATITDAGHVARMLAVLHPASTERRERTAELHRAVAASTTSCTFAADPPMTSRVLPDLPVATATDWCSAVEEPAASPTSVSSKR